MWTHHLIVATILLAVANICRADCQSRDLICYECDSGTDFKCKGPFNETERPNDQLPVKKCNGCCVKIVQNANLSNENVRRTCTSQLEINLFMVKVGTCMMESIGTGHMCFCEADKCNRVSPISHSNPVLLLILSTILVLRSAVLETSTCFVERCNHHVVYH